MATTGVRIGLLGATGALGSEVLAALDAASLRVAEIVAVASEESVGLDIEFQGEIYPVATELPNPRGLDLVFCCAPAEPSLAWIREALRAEVPVVDCSGALLASDDVPVGIAVLGGTEGLAGVPAVSAVGGTALAWSLALAPIHARAGLRRVVGTVLDAASVGGREGIAALSTESLALFNQKEPPEPTAFDRPIAFDCLPGDDPGGSVGLTLARVLGAQVPVSLTRVQIPAFVGQGSVLQVETERPLEPKEAVDALESAPGVEAHGGEGPGPSLRAAAGRDVVLVGPVSRDPTCAVGLRLWIAADPLQLAAVNAVALAAARLAAR